MWGLPNLTPAFIERLEAVLELYAQPHNPKPPVLCVDEQSKQLLEETREVHRTTPGTVRKRDDEYKRNGTRNIFVAVEPNGAYREVTVTDRRPKPDFAKEIRRSVDLPRSRNAETIHLVLENLNTHFEKSFLEAFSKQEAKRILSKMQFHHTPKHASWLKMAEIDISILDRPCIRGRIPTGEALTRKLTAWQQKRKTLNAGICWKFTVKDARRKFKSDGSESD
jgi:hypothetical protein